jgi:hypothetical protein
MIKRISSVAMVVSDGRKLKKRIGPSIRGVEAIMKVFLELGGTK